MSTDTFQALVIRESAEGKFTGKVENKLFAELPDNEVLIRVEYSSLNFKDALSATGVKRVSPNFPHTPGIDAVGTVVESTNSQFKAGDDVVVTGYDLGMSTAGGYGQYISVPAAWVVKRPASLSAREAMILGTAGFTAGMSVDEILRQGISPEQGPILVTGASGGVGSVAISILSKLGFDVVAVSNKEELHTLLTDLGATAILSREELDDSSGRVLLKEQYAAVVDTVGGNILFTAIKSTKYRGIVTACGWVAGDKFEANIYPFMIRGIHVVGIDSVQCPMPIRLGVWNKLANEWKPENLELIAKEIGLNEVMQYIQPILSGQVSGRIIVKHG